MKKEYDKGKLGIAKRNIKEGEIFELPLDGEGKFLQNENINFIEGKGLKDLKMKEEFNLSEELEREQERMEKK